MIKKYAIIVGGGSGSRMNAELPKQFLLVNNKPILMHSIEKFAMDNIELILVLNVDYHEYWNSLCKEFNFQIPHQLVKGGTSRFESVKNGLAKVTQPSLVAIHDAVRPIISKSCIRNAYLEAEAKGNAVLAINSKDTVRRIQGNTSQTIPRDEIYLIQTPQIFSSDILIKAYKQAFRNEFTDDASVVEKLGVTIHLVAGEQSNLKITYPEDLKTASILL